MKKAVVFIVFLAVFQSCVNDSQPTLMEKVDLHFDAFSIFESENNYKNTYSIKDCSLESARFYIFNAMDIKTPMIKEKVIVKDLFDFDKVKSEVITLIEKEQTLKLEDGTLLKPIKIEINKATEMKGQNTSFSQYLLLSVDLEKYRQYDYKISAGYMLLFPGQYFVVAVCPSSGVFIDRKDKYSGKFIAISSDMSYEEKHLRIAFPIDWNYKGYFDWIDVTGTWY